MIEADAKKVLEAVLFSTADVLTPKQIGKVLGNTRPSQVSHLVASLNDEYQRTNRTFRIEPVAHGYQMRTLPIYKTWIRKLEPLKPLRLTQPALEILSIVAYRQPVTRAVVQYLRGVDASHGLRALLEKKLIRIVGKDQAPGRPILYGTSRAFLSLFNLKDLRDLPTIDDLDLSPTQGDPRTELAQEAS